MGTPSAGDVARKVNVLLVDDEPANLLALEVVLADSGANLVKAQSGEDALRHLLNEEFAVILLDVKMTGMSGFETARLIRGRNKTRNIPIIFLTAFDTDLRMVEEAYTVGAVDFLVKPFVPVILKAKVATFIELFEKTEQVKRQAEDLQQVERREFDRKLAEEKVRQLEESNRHKDELLALLAHELRNPLAPIRNGLQIIKAAKNDIEKIDEVRAMMDRRVGHLTRIVDHLIDVSKMTRRKITLNKQRLDLARLVREASEDEQSLFEQANLALHIIVPETPIWVLGDETRLMQVLQNLLRNAMKFTDGGGKVFVEVRAEDQEVVLVVSDTGVGIEPDLLPHLFEIFSQGDRTLERSKGGLGMGLALVHGLVDLHGGSVRAISAGPGKGSEFAIRFPLEPEPAALSEMRKPQRREGNGKRLRILVVEDNKDSADSLRMLLEVYGYEVSVAYTGPAGVKTAEEWTPDVVICDIGLPGLDGYGVASRLRRNPAMTEVPIIAVTGYGQEDDRRRSREAGFNHHLVKPVDPETLQSLLVEMSTA
jgi:signal transduction histidine kinase